MDEKNELQEYFDRLEGKLDKSIARSSNMLIIIVTIFLFIFGGSFAFTSRVNSELYEVKKVINNIGADLTDIDGALKNRFPDSAVFGQRHKREVNKRGG